MRMEEIIENMNNDLESIYEQVLKDTFENQSYNLKQGHITWRDFDSGSRSY